MHSRVSFHFPSFAPGQILKIYLFLLLLFSIWNEDNASAWSPAEQKCSFLALGRENKQKSDISGEEALQVGRF